jgi:hypothetical protein
VHVLIDEHIRMDGTIVRTSLGFDAGRVTVTCDDGIHGALSPSAIGKVMERYGKPLDTDVAPMPSHDVSPRLSLGDAGALCMLRFRARVDAEPRDYLVWERPGREPLAALSNGVAAALRYVCMQLSEQKS